LNSNFRRNIELKFISIRRDIELDDRPFETTIRLIGIEILEFPSVEKAVQFHLKISTRSHNFNLNSN